MKIFLVRHGQTAEACNNTCCGGETDVQLSEIGILQSLAAVLLLAREHVQHIVTSSLVRCDTVGRIASEALGISHRVDHRLRERCLGPWEGRPWPAIEAHQQEIVQCMRFNPVLADAEGVENANAFRERVLLAWNDLLQEDVDSIAVVTHFQVIKVILHHLFGECECTYRPENGSVFLLEVDAEGRASIVERPMLPLQALASLQTSCSGH